LLPCFGAGGVCNATDGCCSFMIYKASFSIPIYLSPGKLPNGKVLVCHLAQTRLAVTRLTPSRCYRSHCTNSRRCARPAKLPKLGTFSRLDGISRTLQGLRLSFSGAVQAARTGSRFADYGRAV
jgi:hypothetical protein